MNIRDLLIDSTEICTKNAEIKNLTSSPSEIGEATLFFLLPGVNRRTDGFLDDVLRKHPAAVVCTEGVDASASDTTVPILHSHDVRRSFSFALWRFFGLEKENVRFFGITGSNGKTSTATFLKTVLEGNGRTVGAFLTGKILCGTEDITPYDYSMTTPDAPLLYRSIKRMCAQGCTDIVMEVSSHSLALGKVAPIPFLCSAFTGLSPEHLDFHKTMEEYFRAKLILPTQSAHSVIVTDTEYGQRMKKLFPAALCYGKDEGFRTLSRKRTPAGTEFVFFLFEKKYTANIEVCGDFQVDNALCALGCAVTAGIEPTDCLNSLRRVNTIPGRMETFRKDITVIVDYAHTPAAMENLLLNVRAEYTKNRMICIFGCGGERDREKRPKMAKAAQEYADLTVITSDNSRGEDPKEIIADILCGFSGDAVYSVIENREQAIRETVENARPGDVIVVAGKGREPYLWDKDGKHPYDECRIVNEALERRKRVIE